jgi:thiamine-phosphate diphosphorylase
LTALDTSRLRLYLVVDPDLVRGVVVDVVTAAIDGGVTTVQLRMKSATDGERESLAGELAGICRVRSTLFLVNDRVDIAMAVDADGVHLGVDDLSIEAARRQVGPRLVIGFSPETDDQASSARRRGVDYLGVGPVFATTSKADAGEAIGIDALRRRREISDLPTIGIGGITHLNAADVMATGASGIAVMSAILGSPDPQGASEQLHAGMTSGRR